MTTAGPGQRLGGGTAIGFPSRNRYRCLRQTSLQDGLRTDPDSGGSGATGHPVPPRLIGRESTPQLTLILVIMRPGEGVWQTVDARVTAGGQLRDNFAYKQLSVHRWDGTLLLAYTGLAEVHPSGESMFDWIRTTLRGRNQGIEADLLHLQERLTRDIGRSRYRRVPLTIVAAGVVGSRPDENAPLVGRRMARWVLTNEA
jgi:hypothetical protein